MVGREVAWEVVGSWRRFGAILGDGTPRWCVAWRTGTRPEARENRGGGGFAWGRSPAREAEFQKRKAVFQEKLFGCGKKSKFNQKFKQTQILNFLGHHMHLKVTIEILKFHLSCDWRGRDAT